ncbi:hypothetical protein [uncultured Dialister sp.]|uniref:hypothetical protein n=1 Tax=uncultured Dialister sp. TaxID=278064 RepID=UPI002634A482|nr:hypothetical protein [uncultured Dialister sp.]
MEQNHNSNFDYGRVRDKMLKSWGQKSTEKEAAHSEKPTPEPEFQKKSFKESEKSDKIIKRKVIRRKVVRRKEPSEPVIKPALPKSVEGQTEKSGRILPAHSEEKHVRRMDTGTPLEERNGETGFSIDSGKGIRQWAVYDAVFGPPRCKRPWRPFR